VGKIRLVWIIIVNYGEFLQKIYTTIKPRQQSTVTLIVDCKVDPGSGRRALTWSELISVKKKKEVKK